MAVVIKLSRISCKVILGGVDSSSKREAWEEDFSSLRSSSPSLVNPSESSFTGA